MNIENIKKLLEHEQFLAIWLTIVISIIILKLKDRIFNRAIKKINRSVKDYKRKITYFKLTSHIINYVIIIIALLFILEMLGFNVTSFIAGLGVVSVIVGLAVQDALKDIIMGFNIIVDNYYSVGDIIKIGDVEGKVVELGVKATKLKDINTDNILVIANRNISQALRISDQLVVSVPVPYDEKTEKIDRLMEIIVAQIKENENVKDAKYLGLSEFEDSAVIYKMLIQCSPEYKFSVRRAALRIIKISLDKSNISIPYPQLDVHNV